MAEQTIVEFIEDWQTGFYFLLGIGLAGIVIGAAVSSVTGGPGRYLGAIGGMILAFLLISYVLYADSL